MFSKFDQIAAQHSSMTVRALRLARQEFQTALANRCVLRITLARMSFIERGRVKDTPDDVDRLVDEVAAR